MGNLPGLVRSRRVASLLAMAIAWSLPAFAQDAVTSFAQLPSILREGDTVVVRTDDGRRTTARVVALSPDALALTVSKADSTRPGRTVTERLEFGARDVVSIEREAPDSLWNGGLIGMAIGAGPGLWAVIAMSGGSDDLAGVMATLVPKLAAAGFAGGALLDATIHRHAVVFSRGQARRGGVSVAPILSTSSVGIVGRLTFR